MGLFGFGKKKEEKAPVCACQGGCAADNAATAEAVKAAGGTLSIKVLGTGCASCHALLENTQKAVTDTGTDAAVEYVSDMTKIAGYGVMRVPALVINEKVVTMGKVLKPEEVAALLKQIQG